MQDLNKKIYKGAGNYRIRHILECIRNGLVMAIPIIMLGSISLVLYTFLIDIYQEFITTFAGGSLALIFDTLHKVTFNMLSVYMVVCISFSYIQSHENNKIVQYGGVFTALICFCVFTGLSSDHFDIKNFGVNGMFIAIVCGVCASSLYRRIYEKTSKDKNLYHIGIDVDFNQAISVITPMWIVCTIFVVINYYISTTFGVNDIHSGLINVLSSVFENMGRKLSTAFLFIFISSLMWFFGIHGSDVLESVCQRIFVPALDVNIAMVAANQIPTEIFSKAFFDVFVLMGGCGSTICLFLSILLFSKQKSSKRLARMASVPILFNINELVVFGLPIVFNPIFFIPFITVPLVCVFTSYIAMSSGFVPVVSNSVNWTTPVLISGYLATGSIRGLILQLFNILIGIAIYTPFVKAHDNKNIKNSKDKFNKLVDALKKSEESLQPISLVQLPGSSGLIARGLIVDLNSALCEKKLCMYYQPQYNCYDKCIGVEALLRWQHPVYGMIYPPLVIKLAAESGKLNDLEKYVFSQVADDTPRLLDICGRDIKISINVSAKSIQSDDFVDYIESLINTSDMMPENTCIEVTEQMTLNFNSNTEDKFNHLHELGFTLAIDDFSMGNTSIKYLQEKMFSIVKLDGWLVKDMMVNERSEKIVASIVTLSHELGFKVIAEFVETIEQRDKLLELECTMYQGYLFSPALPLDELKTVVVNKNLVSENK